MNPLRDLLGITKLERRVKRVEKQMASAKDQLQDLKTSFTDFTADVDAKLDELAAAQGDLDPAAQAVFDDLKQAVADADTKIGDADGSDTTPPPADDGTF